MLKKFNKSGQITPAPGTRADMLIYPSTVLVWIAAVVVEVHLVSAESAAFSIAIGGSLFWFFDWRRNCRYDRAGIRR